MSRQNKFICLVILFICFSKFITAQEDETLDEMAQLADLLGLRQSSMRLKRQPSLKSSATKFLLQIYKEISEEDDELNFENTRHKRALDDDDDDDEDHNNFITPFDRQEIDLCNNIITFASRASPEMTNHSALGGDMLLNFNLNDLPNDLQLQHAAIRLYQNPLLGRFSQNVEERNFTINIYQPFGHYLLNVGTSNANTDYHGWLELNVTKLFQNWLRFRTLKHVLYGNDLIIGVTLHKPSKSGTGQQQQQQQIAVADVGLVSAYAQADLLDMQPFITAYFNGPDLLTKMQRKQQQQRHHQRQQQRQSGTSQTKRREQRHADSFGGMPQQRRRPYYSHSSAMAMAHDSMSSSPKACERRNFTLDFKYLGMEKSVIAPKTFEAFFCFGECNFPLGTPANNATNHAIVQTLMHLKRPNLPKPCCVPVKLASISILYSVNEDSVNLMRFSQIVAKECGCR